MTDYKYLGNFAACEPWAAQGMSCDDCEVSWTGCWDNFQCPKCGKGDLPTCEIDGVVSSPGEKENMSDLYTIASLKHQSGLAEHGRLTREESIKRLRDMALSDKAHAEAILNAPDDAFYVRVVRGVYVQHMVEVL